MATVPSTPPRRHRVVTPEAPRFGPLYDESRDRRKGKEKEKEKERPAEKHKEQKARAPSTPNGKSKSKRPAVSFVPSPPGSPSGLGFPSPGSSDAEEHSKEKASSAVKDLFGATKAKGFKPPPASLEMDNPFGSQEATRRSSGAGSLPTPAKTPSTRKRKFVPSASAVEEEDAGTSRVLFSTSVTKKTEAKASSSMTVEEILGTPSSQRKTHRQKRNSLTALGDELFGTSALIGSAKLGGSEKIEIYTDTNARIPEYDPSPDNPFINQPESVRQKHSASAKRRRERLEESRAEFERVRAGRDDGMVYNFRGKKIFRKFEEEGSLSPPAAPRRLFIDRHTIPEAPIFEDLSDLESGSDKEEQPSKATVGKGEKAEEEEEEEEEATDSLTPTEPAINPPNSTQPPNKKDLPEEVPEVKGIEGKEADEEEEHKEKEPEKQARAPSVARSVSSVASSNILSFGRRPRITKSVSNLSNSERKGTAAGLRRSRRLASAEPDLALSTDAGIGKSSTLKPRFGSKRARTEDSSLEETERWAMGVNSGARKRSKS